MTREPLTVWFVGVRTAGSASHAAFPGWIRALGLEGELHGVDLPLDARPDAYRDLVERLRAAEPSVAGAVITAHKARVFEDARDRVDHLDRYARACREISVLRRDGRQIHGAAIEPRSTAAALSAMLEPGHWRRSSAELHILGAGGTAAALLAGQLLDGAPDPPGTVVLVDVDLDRARRLAGFVARVAPGTAVEVWAPDAAPARIVAAPAGSLVLNATGIGKDRPGAPLPLPFPWPEGAIVWDLNYRGDLALLRDAQAQAAARGLAVHDGWLLFVRGWAEALGSLLQRPVTDATLEAFRRAADAARPLT